MTARIDVRHLSPAELAGLTDGDFRDVVDADLRRRVNPEGLPEAVSRALRAPQHVHRWLAVLQGILRSVDGQLRAAEADYESEAGPLQARIDALPDGSERRALRAELVAKRSEHMRRAAARERFRTGVEEHLVVAEQIIEASRVEQQDTGATAERDDYAHRILNLERAIRAHRKAVHQDLVDDEEPTPYEKALWALLDD